MTSSLVGSEMCIRDSLKVGLFSSQPLCPLRVELLLCSVPVAFARGAVVPVSYTHLTLPTICSV
eukprot:3226784-Prorocentrum_lima.AAC.1